MVDGDNLALEVLWTGKLAVALGSLSAGSEMRAHSAIFFEFKDGRIVGQRNYDGFEESREAVSGSFPPFRVCPRSLSPVRAAGQVNSCLVFRRVPQRSLVLHSFRTA